MKISRGFALATLMTLAASPVFAFNLSDAANAVSAMQGGNQSSDTTVAAAPEAGNLLNTLGTQLNITPEQAIGGTGALLGLAKNRLSPTDYSQLSQSVPGLDLLAGVSALGGLSGLGGLLGNSGGEQTGLGGLLGNSGGEQAGLGGLLGNSGGEQTGLGGLLGNSSGNQTALDNALGNVKDTNDLNNAFTALGMDTGMIGMFAPVLLQFLGQQGVAGTLLQSLGSAWGLGTTTGNP
ncbi:DUF2780 domain-containing protein [Pseudomonas sp. LS1212]|uniref:DUF2780 domain-containing protein n=1 Tax=Pseudomonas sp. LS1212 TaxID=2972478 RepID=UPI00215BD392|nr:DUF2780 domain-containing protein [Pseudomonas sp. LS1212]UVJ43687.1 DUF2780 domain-containing protein [Pseudomonas sp. LS1212]